MYKGICELGDWLLPSKDMVAEQLQNIGEKHESKPWLVVGKKKPIVKKPKKKGSRKKKLEQPKLLKPNANSSAQAHTY